MHAARAQRRSSSPTFPSTCTRSSAACSSSRRRRPTSGSRSPRKQTEGWLYLVTVAGTTGARSELSPALAPLVERTRSLTDVPLYAGFGISTPEQAAAAAELADGVVVGSAALVAAEDGAPALERFVAQLRAALA